MTETPDPEKPGMFLRKGRKGGLFFFSPKGTVIYYMSSKHVRELLEGKRDFACIHRGIKADVREIPGGARPE